MIIISPENECYNGVFNIHEVRDHQSMIVRGDLKKQGICFNFNFLAVITAAEFIVVVNY